VAPFHGVIFGSMLRNITREAEKLERLRQAGLWKPLGTPRPAEETRDGPR
jgi:hypothetical protein